MQRHPKYKTEVSKAGGVRAGMGAVPVWCGACSEAWCTASLACVQLAAVPVWCSACSAAWCMSSLVRLHAVRRAAVQPAGTEQVACLTASVGVHGT